MVGMGQSAVRVRLDVKDVQAGMLLGAAGARRFAHNWAVGQFKANADRWAAEGSYDIPKADRVRPLTYFTLTKQWTAAKPTVGPWAGDHSTWAFLYGIQAAANAHQSFLAGRARFPRFKSRHRDRPRFTGRDGLQLEPGRVRLAKYGWVDIAAPCPAQADLRRLLRRGRARLLNITVSRHSDGHWYATVCFEREARVPAEQRTPPTGPTVGVDRGVKTSAVVATAGSEPIAELAGQRHLRDAARKLAHLQRNFSRTTRGSANRAKAARRVARAHARVGALRADTLHTFTARLARTHGVVVVEDLATANLMANHHLAAAIGDQGWGELARQLTYKAQRHGDRVVVAHRWFPSSKTCSCCGWVTPKPACTNARSSAATRTATWWRTGT
jgi:putative transposase